MAGPVCKIKSSSHLHPRAIPDTGSTHRAHTGALLSSPRRKAHSSKSSVFNVQAVMRTDRGTDSVSLHSTLSWMDIKYPNAHKRLLTSSPPQLLNSSPVRPLLTILLPVSCSLIPCSDRMTGLGSVRRLSRDDRPSLTQALFTCQWGAAHGQSSNSSCSEPPA